MTASGFATIRCVMPTCFMCADSLVTTGGIEPAAMVQVVCTPDKKKVTAESLSLVEVGPRMTLNPIAVFDGSFSGPKLYSNPNYIPPNVVSDKDFYPSGVNDRDWGSSQSYSKALYYRHLGSLFLSFAAAESGG